MKKKCLGFGFFLGDISGVGVGLFGRGYWALGPNYKSEVFWWSF